MHNWEVSDNLKDILRKLFRKNKSLYEQLMKKIEEIKNAYDVNHYKNLKYNMKDSKEVHIGHFVLVFQYNQTTDTILFDDFAHHDDIFKK